MKYSAPVVVTAFRVGRPATKFKRKLQDMPRLLVLLTDDRTGQGRAGYQAVISRCAGILSGEFAEYKA